MFRYKVGTVRIFGSQENLTLVQENISGSLENILTDDYLQFVVPKDQLKEFTDGLRELCDDGQFTGAIVYRGVQYGEPSEDIIVSYDNNDWHIVREELKNYGFVQEYYVYRNSAEYTQEKQLRKIRKVENTLLRLLEKQEVTVA